jgi:hypothetical protein
MFNVTHTLADVDEIEDDASDFNTNTSAILQGITMTSHALRPSGHREYLDCDFLLISVVYFQRKVKCRTNLTNSSKWRQDRR